MCWDGTKILQDATFTMQLVVKELICKWKELKSLYFNCGDGYEVPNRYIATYETKFKGRWCAGHAPYLIVNSTAYTYSQQSRKIAIARSHKCSKLSPRWQDTFLTKWSCWENSSPFCVYRSSWEISTNNCVPIKNNKMWCLIWHLDIYTGLPQCCQVTNKTFSWTSLLLVGNT